MEPTKNQQVTDKTAPPHRDCETVDGFAKPYCQTRAIRKMKCLRSSPAQNLCGRECLRPFRGRVDQNIRRIVDESIGAEAEGASQGPGTSVARSQHIHVAVAD